MFTCGLDNHNDISKQETAMILAFKYKDILTAHACVDEKGSICFDIIDKWHSIHTYIGYNKKAETCQDPC